MRKICYRCEQEIEIPPDVIRIEQGHGKFSVTIDGRYHSFSNKTICLTETTSEDIFDNTLVEIEPESEQPISLENTGELPCL
jgi:hypothetical protein